MSPPLPPKKSWKKNLTDSRKAKTRPFLSGFRSLPRRRILTAQATRTVLHSQSLLIDGNGDEALPDWYVRDQAATVLDP